MAAAGGSGTPALSRTIPVAVTSYRISNEADGRLDGLGVFVCADGSGAFIESLPGALRLTRLGQVSLLKPSDLTRDAEGRSTLRLRGAGQTCRPATPGDSVLKPGAVQVFICANVQQVVAAPFAQAVVISSFRSGQRPDLSGLMPRVNAGLYQNSEWIWMQAGAVWELRFHGKVAATGCRLKP